VSTGLKAQAATPAGKAGVIVSPSHRDRYLAELGVLGTVLVWAGNFVVVKAEIGTFGPLTFTASRYVVATLALFTVLRLRQGVIRWPAGHGLVLMLLGVIGFGFYQVLWTVGLTSVTAGSSALLIAAAPVFTALLAGAVGLDRLTRPKLAGALLSFAGVAIVVAAGRGLSIGGSITGDLLTLAAAAMWAIYTTAGARMLRHVNPMQATAWSLLGGTLFLLPFGLWEVLARPPVGVTALSLVGVAYSGALAAGISTVFVMHAIRLLGPTRVTAFQFLTPAGAVVLGAIVLSEPVGLYQLVGGVVIVLGVALTRRPSVVPARFRSRAGALP
jgi:drug/metabolite transporter (DMT)-like permease